MAIENTTEQINEENNPQPDETITETANQESADDINVFLMLNNLINTPNIKSTTNETNITLEQEG